MASAAFLSSDLSQTASFGGSVTVAGLGWDQLKDPQPRARARVSDSVVQLIIDLGGQTSVDNANLISTTLDRNASIELRMSATDPLALSSLAYDSGVLTGITDPAWNGNVVMVLAAAVSVRYLRWDISAAASPVDIGKAPCGALFRPQYTFQYGAQEGRTDTSLRDTNADTGAEFGVQLASKRVRVITLPALSKTELRVGIDAMDRLIGAAGDVLFVEDTAASAADMARDSIWGVFRASGDAFAARNSTNRFQRQARLVERL